MFNYFYSGHKAVKTLDEKLCAKPIPYIIINLFINCRPTHYLLLGLFFTESETARK